MATESPPHTTSNNWCADKDSAFKGTVIIGAVILLLVLFRFGAILLGKGGPTVGRSRGTSSKVAVDKTRMDELDFNYEVVGNVESVQTVDVVARTSGLIEEVNKLAGDQVKKGELLVKIDDARALASVYKAQSDLANARFTYHQLQSQEELTRVQAESDVSIARADLSAARAGVKKAESVYSATISQGDATVAQAQANMESVKAQMRQAEVAYNQSKVSYERYLNLQRKGFVSAADVQDSYAEVLSAHATVEARKADLEAAEKQVANARQQATKDNVSTQADIQTSRLAAESARANVAKADAGTSRSQSFQQQLLAQKSLVDAAQAELQSAQLQLQDTELRSPVDGFVSERQLDPGTLVNLGDRIMTVQAGREVWVVASLPQEIYNYVDRGASCQIKVDGLRDRLFDAYIFSKDSAVDAASRQFNIRVKIDDPNNEVKPGMFARVLLTLGPDGERLTVPTSALLDRNDVERTAQVYKVVEGKIEIVNLKLGPSDGEKALVLEGLEEGDTVVVQTARSLRQGQEVETEMVQGEEPRKEEVLKVSPTPGPTGSPKP